MRTTFLLTCSCVVLAACGGGTIPPVLAAATPDPMPNARPEAGAISPLESMLAPCTAEARATYPEVVRRFDTGLPRGQSLFVVTVLHDSLGHTERVYVAVDSLKGGEIFGRLWSQLVIVRGFTVKQEYHFPDSDLVDWMISMPDGSEEGNWSGKFMQSYQATGHPPKNIC